MNNYVAGGVGFGLGALAGVAFSYIFLKKKMDEREKAEIQSVKDAYEELSNRKNSRKSEPKAQNAQKSNFVEAKTVEKSEGGALVRPKVDTVGVNYGAYYASEEQYDDAQNDIEEQKAEKEHPVEASERPYKVPRDGEDAVLSDPALDVISCTVYLGGKEPVLVEDTDPEHLAMDIFSTVGGPDWDKFITNSEDDDRFFVDPRTAKVFEVSKDDSDYVEVMEDYYGGRNL